MVKYQYNSVIKTISVPKKLFFNVDNAVTTLNTDERFRKITFSKLVSQGLELWLEKNADLVRAVSGIPLEEKSPVELIRAYVNYLEAEQ